MKLIRKLFLLTLLASTGYINSKSLDQEQAIEKALMELKPLTEWDFEPTESFEALCLRIVQILEAENSPELKPFCALFKKLSNTKTTFEAHLILVFHAKLLRDNEATFRKYIPGNLSRSTIENNFKQAVALGALLNSSK